MLKKICFIVPSLGGGGAERVAIHLMNNLNLVRENLNYISSLGIDTYKEIFINYPDKFLLDNSVFVEIFSKYETNELIEKLNANYKLIEYL